MIRPLDPSVAPGDGPILGLAVAPDGTTGAVSTAAGLRLVDLVRGGSLRALPAAPGGGPLRFSADGRTLAAAGDGEVRFLDVEAGEVRSRIEVPRSLERRRIDFSRDLRRIAIADAEARVRDVDPARPSLGELLGGATDSFELPCAYRSPIAISPDGARAAFTRHGGALVLVDAATGAEVALVRGHGERLSGDSEDLDRVLEPAEVTSIAFTPDGAAIATAANSGDVSLFRVASGERLWQRPAGFFYPSLAFTPDGRRLVCGVASAWTVIVLDAASGAEVAAIRAASLELSHLAVTPDGHAVVVPVGQGALRVYDVETGRPRAGVWDARVEGLGISADGSRLVERSAYGVDLWDVGLGRRWVRRAAQGWSAAITADGSLVAGANREGWEVVRAGSRDRVAGGRPVPPSGAGAIAFLGGASAASLGTSRVLTLGRHARVWRLDGAADTDRPERAIEVEGDPDLLVAAPGAPCVAFASRGGRALWTWDANTPGPARARYFPADLSALTAGPLGAFVAAGAADGTIYLLPWQGCAEPRAFSGQRGPIAALALGPGERVLACLDPDGLRLICTTCGRELRLERALGTRSAALAWSADGRTLACALGSDERLADIAPGLFLIDPTVPAHDCERPPGVTG